MLTSFRAMARSCCPQYIEENGEEHFDLNLVGTGSFKFVSTN